MDAHSVDGEHCDVVFGDNCERRIYFPSSAKSNYAAGDIAFSAQDHIHPRPRPRSRDPVTALGLFSPSPYAGLKKLLVQVHRRVSVYLVGCIARFFTNSQSCMHVFHRCYDESVWLPKGTLSSWRRRIVLLAARVNYNRRKVDLEPSTSRVRTPV